MGNIVYKSLSEAQKARQQGRGAQRTPTAATTANKKKTPLVGTSAQRYDH